MSGDPFSLADAEAAFTAADLEHVDQTVASAPPLSPELREQLRALFASARVTRPATRPADAA